MTHFEKSWRLLQLARKAATIHAIVLMLMAFAWTTTGLLLLIDSRLHFLPTAALGPLQQAHWLPLLALLGCVTVGFSSLWTEAKAHVLVAQGLWERKDGEVWFEPLAVRDRDIEAVVASVARAMEKKGRPARPHGTAPVSRWQRARRTSRSRPGARASCGWR